MYLCLNRATAGASLGFEEFVKLSADAGFEGCDVDMRWASERGAEATRELFVSHNQRFGGWGPLIQWRKDEAAFSAGLGDLVKQAKVAGELGIDTCSTWIMPSSESRFIENWKLHVERLGLIARVLADHGRRLGLEFVAPYHLRRHFPHEFIFTPGQMLELAADIGPNVGLLVDSFHCHSAGIDTEEIAALPADKIVLVHINDCPAGPLTGIKDFARVLPGEGIIDLRGLHRAVQAAGYNGPLSLEVFSEELKQMSPNDAARAAWKATKAVFLN